MPWTWQMAALTFLWATQTLAIFHTFDGLQTVSVLLFAIYLVDGFFRGRVETRLIWIMALAISAFALRHVTFANLAQAATFTMLFTAWLPVLQASRIVARKTAGVAESQRRITALPDGRREPGFLFGAFGFGGVLNTGTYSLMAALVPVGATEMSRRRYAQACLRGINLTITWSPFFVAMAFVQQYLPNVPLWQIMLTGLPISAAGLLLSVWLYTRDSTRLSPQVSADGNSNGALVQAGLLVSSLRCLVPLWPILAICGGGVVAVTTTTGLGTLQSVIISLPVLIALYTLWRRLPVADMARELTQKLPDMQNEITLISAGMMLGFLLRDEPQVAATFAPIISSIPIWLTPGLIIAAMVVLGVCNIHPIISGAALLGAIIPSASHAADIAIFQAVLVGWSTSTIVSLSALSLVIASSMFSVRPLSLVFGRNMIYLLLFVPMVGAYLALLA